MDISALYSDTLKMYIEGCHMQESCVCVCVWVGVVCVYIYIYI